MRGKLWSNETRCSLFIIEHPLIDNRPRRRLPWSMNGMNVFAAIFHIMGPKIIK